MYPLWEMNQGVHEDHCPHIFGFLFFQFRFQQYISNTVAVNIFYSEETGVLNDNHR